MRNALEDIAEASGKAEDTAAHPGYVDNDGYYHKWNATIRTYEKTDVNLKGEKGDTFTIDDLTDEQKASLKGDPFTFDDLTDEQKTSLKGDKGDTGYLRIVNHGTDDTTYTVPVNEMHVWGEVT